MGPYGFVLEQWMTLSMRAHPAEPHEPRARVSGDDRHRGRGHTRHGGAQDAAGRGCAGRHHCLQRWPQGRRGRRDAAGAGSRGPAWPRGRCACTDLCMLRATVVSKSRSRDVCGRLHAQYRRADGPWEGCYLAAFCDIVTCCAVKHCWCLPALIRPLQKYMVEACDLCVADGGAPAAPAGREPVGRNCRSYGSHDSCWGVRHQYCLHPAVQVLCCNVNACLHNNMHVDTAQVVSCSQPLGRVEGLLWFTSQSGASIA